ncbi:hypothetical protein [Acinetobacter soli]|uniref:hypothetical protein n=1 Tax=Acinetobacter soli TaxID=487316 RepID=UPI00124FBDCB|nr:hypothetical protein [Acinetobacter soli]
MSKENWLIASKQRAIELGYEPIEDPEAFGGEVFIKNGFKWIHDISLLKQSLNVQTDEALENLGYHVGDYYDYNSPKNKFLEIKAKREWENIMNDYWS